MFIPRALMSRKLPNRKLLNRLRLCREVRAWNILARQISASQICFSLSLETKNLIVKLRYPEILSGDITNPSLTWGSEAEVGSV